MGDFGGEVETGDEGPGELSGAGSGDLSITTTVVPNPFFVALSTLSVVAAAAAAAGLSDMCTINKEVLGIS